MTVTKLPTDTMFQPCEYIMDEVRHRGWSVQRFAEELGVSPYFAEKIVHGDVGICMLLAERLAKCFGTSATMWYRLQQSYDAANTQPDRRTL